jgi:hypothetical protein
MKTKLLKAWIEVGPGQRLICVRKLGPKKYAAEGEVSVPTEEERIAARLAFRQMEEVEGV